MSSLQWQHTTSIGHIYLVASDKGLQGIYFNKQKIPFATALNSTDSTTRHLTKTLKQLEEYFAGKRREFDLTFDIQGTTFQQRVWNALCKIPYGKTCSYTDIAKKINHPKAMRAVGSANGKNPLCIVIPCHRVIAADGSLGGYSSGIAIKKKLLALESL